MLDDLMTGSVVSISFTPESSNEICAIVQTYDDVILEGEEVFSFSFRSGDQVVTDITPDEGEIRILDNDSKC